MSDRITEIEVQDLTLEHLWLSVEATGCQPSSTAERTFVGQLARFARHPESVLVTLGPTQHPIDVRVYNGSTIKVLDAPQPERKTFNFGASE